MSKILIVDDNHDNVLILSILLENYGINDIVSALDGNLTKSTIDANDDLTAIFLDLSMPLSGFTIFDQIKHYDIPVFAYSVYSNFADKALAQGFSGFLEKPIKEGELEKIMASLGYQWRSN
ncbi:MAG: response regulator [Phototrophicaceae bacterium]